MKEYNIASIPSIYANRIEPRKSQQQQQTLAPTFEFSSLPVSKPASKNTAKHAIQDVFPDLFQKSNAQMMGTMITSTNDFAFDDGQEEDLKYMVVRSKAKMKPRGF